MKSRHISTYTGRIIVQCSSKEPGLVTQGADLALKCNDLATIVVYRTIWAAKSVKYYETAKFALKRL